MIESFRGQRNERRGSRFSSADSHGEAMKIIGAALLMLSLASAGMAVTMTLATAHPQTVAQR